MTDDSAASHTFCDSVVVHATAARLYEMISDVTRMGEWSPQCRGGRWDHGQGPVVGAQFTGHNEKPGRVWETRNEVVIAEPGREFAWVTEGSVRWGYTMTDADGPGVCTRLTESWRLSASGVAQLRDQYGDDARAEIDTRVADAHSGIPATLAAMKACAESG